MEDSGEDLATPYGSLKQIKRRSTKRNKEIKTARTNIDSNKETETSLEMNPRKDEYELPLDHDEGEIKFNEKTSPV